MTATVSTISLLVRRLVVSEDKLAKINLDLYHRQALETCAAVAEPGSHPQPQPWPAWTQNRSWPQASHLNPDPRRYLPQTPRLCLAKHHGSPSQPPAALAQPSTAFLRNCMLSRSRKPPALLHQKWLIENLIIQHNDAPDRNLGPHPSSCAPSLDPEPAP